MKKNCRMNGIQSLPEIIIKLTSQVFFEPTEAKLGLNLSILQTCSWLNMGRTMS